jgi:RNase H-fold protein (predicted Holliday junction resolvase)
MDFGTKNIGVAAGVAAVVAVIIYMKDAAMKNNRLRAIIASLLKTKEFSEESEKIKKEVQDEELDELVDGANDRLRKRRDS